MADGIFNISKGAFVEKIRDASGNTFLLLLKAAEADGTLIDYDDVAAMLGAAGNTEADFTNYARKTGITSTITVDDSNDRVDVDAPDQTFSSAGGTTDNTLVKAIFGEDEGGTDATRIPTSHHDFSAQTDGNDLTLQLAASGYARAA